MLNMKNVLMIIFVSCFIPLKNLAQIPSPTIPAFTFFTMDEKPFTDKNLPKAKKIFFVFFDADCDHCQRAMKTIGDQYKYFKNAAVYLISIDGKDKINKFMNSYGQAVKGQKNMLLLQDKYRQFITLFHPKKYPSMFLYTADKKLIQYADDPGEIVKFFKPLAAK